MSKLWKMLSMVCFLSCLVSMHGVTGIERELRRHMRQAEGTEPLPAQPGPQGMNQAPVAAGDIAPTMVTGTPQTVLPPYQGYPPYRGERPETAAEQRDDELEDMLDMLRLRHGYMGTALPSNMSMYPDIANYTEPPENEEMEGPEFEAEDMMMMMSHGANYTGPLGEEFEEYEAEDGLRPSERHRVHNMSDMASEEYDPYYNYGYKFQPKENEQIQPTPVISTPSQIEVVPVNQQNNEQIAPTQTNVQTNTQTNTQTNAQTNTQTDAQTNTNVNGTAGAVAKITDVKSVTRERVPDFGGMSASTTFAIVVGSFVGFWLVMGPLVCLVVKVRKHRKENEKRFLIGPRSNNRKSSHGIMEAMIMTELGKFPFRRDKKHYMNASKAAKIQERVSLTDTDMDEIGQTFHDANETVDNTGAPIH